MLHSVMKTHPFPLCPPRGMDRPLPSISMLAAPPAHASLSSCLSPQVSTEASWRLCSSSSDITHDGPKTQEQ